ncbi:MAG: chorismate-binding protein [Flavobacteriales bacterium]
MSIDAAICKNEYFAIIVLPSQFDAHRSAISFNLVDGEMMNAAKSIVLDLAPFAPYSGNAPQAETKRKEHSQTLQAALAAIDGGSLEKVVISCIKHAPRSHQSLDAIFDKLKEQYTGAMVYVLHHPDYGTWMGATPELLLHKKDHSFHTVSLAGTQPYAENREMIWNDKLKREQSLVTDFILQNIAHIGANVFGADGPFTAQAGPLAHLKTDIHFTSAASSHEIIYQLQPTPAVCGLPRENAMRFIQNNSTFARRLYAGRIGLRYNNGDEIHFVNLRCMQVFDDHFELHVGGGIVSGSIVDDEWHETEIKANVLRNLLQ